ncbi:1,3-beta-glucanosyltransferase [Kluyveromyces marxianus]|nr:1,3-beta-glucanosyltransferase [Kluyveromyces marxianus]KAG0683320.1 1,3-beta-glucanosyltransferase [Kluyveromyces marxianus]
MKFSKVCAVLASALCVSAQDSTGASAGTGTSTASGASSTGSSSGNGTLAAIEIKGNAFFDSSSGERFYIRGVDYQPGGSSNLTDPLGDETVCSRDIPYFKELGLNTIRVYTIDNSLDHTACMKLLDEAGIYLILDLNTPGSSISRYRPECSYNADYLQSVFATVDEFAKFDNTLGFFAGNEVINSENTTNTAVYVKATVRDIKKYLTARNYRQIPVGYSAADVSSNRLLAAEYFNCGDDADARIDMFGVNDYSWCGSSSFQVSGYAQKMQLYKNYSIPIFLSEYGCNKVPGSRPFTEVTAIYSNLMSSVFSGGLVYEYSQEDNKYGLVQIDGDSVTELQDYKNLKAEFQKVQNPEGDGGYSESNKYSDCPAYEKGIWESNSTLPSMPDAASAYFKSGAGSPLGTGVITQEMCDKEDDDDSSSSSVTATATSTSKSASASSHSSSASGSASHSGSASSTSSTSKSKGIAGSVEAPLAYGIMAFFSFLI